MNLYQIALKYRSIEDKLYEMEGELTPELEQELEITEAEREETIKNYFYLINEKDVEIDGLKEKVKQFQDILKRKTITRDSLKKQIVKSIAMFGDIQVDEFHLGIRESKAVNVFDESNLSDEFIRTKIVKDPDKTAIKKAIESGKEVKGAEIIINQNLKIK